MKKNILLLLIFVCIGYHQLAAQTNHNIVTVGTSFSPDSISINIGDTVTWKNNGGTHNVNGTTATFPSNPASFTNGSAASGWTFKHVFTMAGTYNYRCDPHAGIGMNGKVVVAGAAMGNETVSESSFIVFPNPSSSNISILATSQKVRKIEIYGMDGRLVYSAQINSSLNNVSIADLSIGVYQLKILENGVTVHQQKISKL